MMDRRAIIASAPVAGAALEGPAVAGAETETPILLLFHKHQAIIKAAGEHVCFATGKGEDEELERMFYQKSDRIEAAMMVLPCTCAADFAAKVIVDTCRGGLVSDWDMGDIWAEARELTGRAV